MDLQEIWKDINGFEGLYQISNLGRIKALSKKSGFLVRKEHILNPTIKENGYEQIDLQKNNEKTKKYIHRLVAEAFIPNLNNYPCINHIDYNKRNNNVSNLGWCTYSQNNSYSRCQIIGGLARRIPVVQYDKQGNVIKIWDCATTASKELNILNTNITACCKGRCKSAYGYIWKYL